MPMLEVEDLHVRYGALQAVHGASFEIGEREIVALIGSNGAGKSTTLKALAGTLPAEGSIRWRGQAVQALPADQRVRRGIALSPEGRRLFARMSVRDNLLTGAHTVGDATARQRTLDEIYALFPRVHERREQLAGSLSGGEQQMVAIGRALMAQPQLLMLDEPSLGIAPKVVAEIAEAVLRLHQRGMSVLLVEQNARLALRLAHRAYALERGQIVVQGRGAELLDHPFVRKAYLGI
ncbi:MAG: ABC transporter ATP-binding protein [Burkholderiaceae bacterium]|nr:ABC transporter ATP-binding protein [Burkholderiaceae bacterium]